MEAHEPKRLYRSRDDRMIGGVCGGLGRHFGIDPVIVRIAAVVLLLFGGASALAYLAFLLVPEEPQPGEPPPTTDRSSAATIIAIVVLVLVGGPLLLVAGLTVAGIALPIAVLVLAGLLVWWLVSGEARGGAGEIAKRSALGIGVLLLCFAIFVGGFWAAGLGGGTAAAAIVIGAGLVLTVSAFAGGWRLLILPALSLALGGLRVGRRHRPARRRGRVQARVGERPARPLPDRRRPLVVDLEADRAAEGRHAAEAEGGHGRRAGARAARRVRGLEATIGMGGVDVFDNDSGVDVDFEDRQTAPPGGRRVVVDADVGLGAFEVQHERRDRWDERHDGAERTRAARAQARPAIAGRRTRARRAGGRSCSTRRTRSTSASRPSPPSPSRRWGRSSSRDGAEPPDVA